MRAVSRAVFRDDPLRLLRAVRLEDELGFRLDPATEELVRRDAALVTRPAGERILGELARLSARAAIRALAELGLLAPLGGSLERLDRVRRGDGAYLLSAVFGDALHRLPISNQLRRYARGCSARELPLDAPPRAIHRFRRATEPWAPDALAVVGAGELAAAVEGRARASPPAARCAATSSGLRPGPEIGRLLELIEEERAAGTISTRDEALELVRRKAGT